MTHVQHASEIVPALGAFQDVLGSELAHEIEASLEPILALAGAADEEELVSRIVRRASRTLQREELRHQRTQTALASQWSNVLEAFAEQSLEWTSHWASQSFVAPGAVPDPYNYLQLHRYGVHVLANETQHRVALDA